jgi:hypothetical protein
MSLYDFAIYVAVGAVIFRLTNLAINAISGVVQGLSRRVCFAVLMLLKLIRYLMLYVFHAIDGRRYPNLHKDDR